MTLRQKNAVCVLILCAIAPVSSAQGWSFFTPTAVDYSNRKKTAEPVKPTRPIAPKNASTPQPPSQPSIQSASRSQQEAQVDIPKRPDRMSAPEEIRAYQLKLKEVGPNAMKQIKAQNDAYLEESRRRAEASRQASIKKADPNWLPKNKEKFVARSTSFYWGQKEAGYEYADYEFDYDIADPKQIEAYTEAIMKMNESGWTTGLSRMSQEITETSDGRRIQTKHEVRFKRPTRR